MDVGALSYSTPSARVGQTGRNAAAEAARPASGASESGQASGPVTAKPEGLYISPVLRYDQSARVAVLFFRDFDTGETRDQIPAERVVEQYRRSGGPQQTSEERRAAENVSSGVGASGFGSTGADAGEASSGGGAAAGAPSLGESFLAAGAKTAAAPASATSAAPTPAAAGGSPSVPAAGTLISFSV